jgi:hypothetical protein
MTGSASLTDLRARVLVLLMDTVPDIWDNGTIDEAIRQALAEYGRVRPLGVETVIDLPGDGREVALDSLPGLQEVTGVWWPYDSAATSETWPPNKVKGFRVWWDDGRPVLFLNVLDGAQPQQDDELRLWYTASPEISGLDSATVTTLPGWHESLIVAGAAGLAAMSRVADLVETAGTDTYAVVILGTFGRAQLKKFREDLDQLRAKEARGGASWGAGWELDKWDESNS